MLPDGGYALVWLAVFLALGALSVPVAGTIFPRLDDRGAGLAIPVAFTTIGVVGYWFGRLAFGLPAVGLALLVLAGGSITAIRRDVVVDWRRYAEVATVFTAAFVFLVGVRAIDPSVVAIGGEKYLDYGLLNSLSRTETIPPEDPWFAGERVRYYYGGHLVAALLGQLTATPPAYTYNLALAGTYATLVSAVYGLAGAVAGNRGLSHVRAGLLAAFLVGIASNLATPVRVLAWLLPGGHSLADAFGIPLTRNGVETVAVGREAFSYWDASRVIPGTINEFPLFAFLNGDLHAHMLSLPFLLLAVGVLYEYWLTPVGQRRRRRLLAFVAMPILAGWLAVVNTWDFPTVLGLTWLTLALAPATPWSVLPRRINNAIEQRLERGSPALPLSAELVRPAVAGGLVGGVALAGVLFVLPFFTGAASTGGRTIALVADRSDPIRFLLVHGAFLLVACWYLASRVDPGPETIRDSTIALTTLLVALLWFHDALSFLFVVPVVAVGWYVIRRGRGGYETLLFVAGAGLVATVEVLYLSEQAGPGRLNTVFKTYVHVWVFWSLAAGVALASILEGRSWPAAAQAADERGRVRTGSISTTTATGNADTNCGSRSGSSEVSTESAVDTTAGADTATSTSRTATVLVLVLLAGLSMYGGLAITEHVDGQDTHSLSLDVREEIRATAPDEAAAFDWLADREGQPRIVEAPTPPRHTYGSSDASGAPPPSRAVSGASTFSGLPTLAGWTHSADYHGEEPYWERVGHAETVFEGSDEERGAVLAQYDVRYVYVGPNERAWYELADLDGDPALEVAAEFGEVRIYEVGARN
ncbi:DUF2298 domain-containing protein [Natronoglomus mannanivorans]|uniref:DUF2298 domain-containing protein n=1 Tax=Natronoglomus mannanivorans TaxID=2979990 RepID=A0AAP2YZ31_9EURY|nr:DUF2298 domain-containing protein [Halobacteria archaeon AArc-xg1-1]